jgi:hypothetical protein
MQDIQIRSSTIIDYKIYSITNPDNKCGGTAFMAINILISINTYHKLLHVILMRRSFFQINGNLCQIHKIYYKCLTWNIYNLYIKYTFSRFDNFPCYWIYFHGSPLSLQSTEGEQFPLHGIAYVNVFVDGRKSKQHPIYRKFICHPIDLVGEAFTNPIMVVVWLLSRCSLPTQLKRALQVQQPSNMSWCLKNAPTILTSWYEAWCNRLL